MIATLVFACALGQGPEKASPAEASVFDALVQETNEIRAFVAVYKSHSADGKEKTTRFVYRAPDDCRFEAPEMLMVTRGGIMNIRARMEGNGSSWARFPLTGRSLDRARAVRAAIATEFAVKDDWWTSELSCGPVIQMSIAPLDDGKHERFNFGVAYRCPRGSLLDWLETFKQTQSVSDLGAEHLVLKTPLGSEMTLSTRTGFVESMIRKDDRGTVTFSLESLDVDPKLEDSAFDVPEPAAGAKDVSDAFVREFDEGSTNALFKKFVHWVSECVTARRFEWNAEARAHAQKVMEEFWASRIDEKCAAWAGKTRSWIDDSCERVAKEYRRAKERGDEFADQRVADRATKIREQLMGSFGDLEKLRPPKTSIPPSDVPDIQLRRDLEDSLDAACGKAVERKVKDPLLQSLEDQIEQIKRGS